MAAATYFESVEDVRQVPTQADPGILQPGTISRQNRVRESDLAEFSRVERRHTAAQGITLMKRSRMSLEQETDNLIWSGNSYPPQGFSSSPAVSLVEGDGFDPETVFTRTHTPGQAELTPSAGNCGRSSSFGAEGLERNSAREPSRKKFRWRRSKVCRICPGGGPCWGHRGEDGSSAPARVWLVREDKQPSRQRLRRQDRETANAIMQWLEQPGMELWPSLPPYCKNRSNMRYIRSLPKRKKACAAMKWKKRTASSVGGFGILANNIASKEQRLRSRNVEPFMPATYSYKDEIDTKRQSLLVLTASSLGHPTHTNLPRDFEDLEPSVGSSMGFPIRPSNPRPVLGNKPLQSPGIIAFSDDDDDGDDEQSLESQTITNLGGANQRVDERTGTVAPPFKCPDGIDATISALDVEMARDEIGVGVDWSCEEADQAAPFDPTEWPADDGGDDGGDTEMPGVPDVSSASTLEGERGSPADAEQCVGVGANTSSEWHDGGWTFGETCGGNDDVGGGVVAGYCEDYGDDQGEWVSDDNGLDGNGSDDAGWGQEDCGEDFTYEIEIRGPLHFSEGLTREERGRDGANFYQACCAVCDGSSLEPPASSAERLVHEDLSGGGWAEEGEEIEGLEPGAELYSSRQTHEGDPRYNIYGVRDALTVMSGWPSMRKVFAESDDVVLEPRVLDYYPFYGRPRVKDEMELQLKLLKEDIEGYERCKSQVLGNT